MDAKNLILERLQRLLCLGLEGTPAAELFAGTAQVWTERLGHINPARLRCAFDSVESNATRWPTPATIKEALPTYESSWIEPLPKSHRIAPDPEQLAKSRERINALIADCAKKIGAAS